MKRSLCDVIFTFIVFFTIDRFIRLIGSMFIEPWAIAKYGDKKTAENIQLGSEIILLSAFAFFLVKHRDT